MYVYVFNCLYREISIMRICNFNGSPSWGIAMRRYKPRRENAISSLSFAHSTTSFTLPFHPWGNFAPAPRITSPFSLLSPYYQTSQLVPCSCARSARASISIQSETQKRLYATFFLPTSTRCIPHIEQETPYTHELSSYLFSLSMSLYLSIYLSAFLLTRISSLILIWPSCELTHFTTPQLFSLFFFLFANQDMGSTIFWASLGLYRPFCFKNCIWKIRIGIF